jgi:prepilin-type N-terminal cleavage/methylation domain-containing protein
MNRPASSSKSGFTLMETVIAIGVLAVLLTGFIAVFGPAAEGIRKSINVQEADRLTSTLEKELVTLRDGQGSASIKTGFDKAFAWIKDSDTAGEAIFVYQYRGDPNAPLRDDGTATPVTSASGTPGEDYIVQPMARRKSDDFLKDDLAALTGGIFVVKCTQLVFNNGELQNGTAGQIVNPKPNSTPPDPAYDAGPFDTTADYPEAVIAFSAEFFSLPSRTWGYIDSEAFVKVFPTLKNPVFTRNLAVRR